MLRLPDIAKLYCVTVDDFYKSNSVAYRNYAERLVAVYEKTDLPEDFLAAEFEFRKLINSDDMTMRDMYNYAFLNDQMYINSRRKAREWYDRILSRDYNEDPKSYYNALDFKIRIDREAGDGYDEIIPYLKDRVEKDRGNVGEWLSLCEGLYYCHSYDEQYVTAKKALELFPENGLLYIHLGCEHERFGRYDEAIECYKTAEKLGARDHCGLRKIAWCYEACVCDYEKAYNMWLDLASIYKNEGLEIEAEITRENADRAKAKMS
ncbi:MAG: hypothetical protein IKL24_02300 [Clostridia bacterium]|nr:hypothetical protein [Clostridia bacterium]